MSTKKIKNTKLAAGATLIALSGFVPEAVMSPAHADTAAIAGSGTFSDGITFVAGTNLLFNTIVATGAAGTARVLPGGGTSAVSAVFVGVTQKAGTFAFNGAVSTSLNLTLSSGVTSGVALATQGKITLNTVKITGPFTAPVTFVGNSKQVGVINNKTADMNVGAQVTWAGGVPLGTFAFPIKVVVSY